MRRVIGDHNAIVAVTVIDAKRSHDVHVAFIQENLGVTRHLAADVAQMDVGYVALP